MKRQGIYWFSQVHDEAEVNKTKLLEELDYDVRVFENPETLLENLADKRVSIVVISDRGEQAALVSLVDRLAHMPEIQGARLLLCCQSNDAKLMGRCAGHGFRDFLQLSWSDHRWIEHFEFAIANGDTEESWPEIAANESKAKRVRFFVPARIVWMNQLEIFIETRARPDIQTQLSLTGALSHTLSPETPMQLMVNGLVKTSLSFRFSEGICASWKTGEQAAMSGEESASMERVRSMDTGEKPKVFVAMQSPALRKTILKYLDTEHYQVHTALQKRSLLMDPKYFSPHLVFIEHKLCSGDSLSRLLDLVGVLPEKSVIVIVGGQDEFTRYRNFTAGRHLEMLAHIPKNLGEIIEKHYLPRTDFCQNQKIFHIPMQHDWSFAEITSEALILGLKGDLIKLKTPFGIGQFSLLRLDLGEGKAAYLKAIATELDEQGHQIVLGRFSSPGPEQLQQFVRKLGFPNRKLG